jgi:hypothetical protein
VTQKNRPISVNSVERITMFLLSKHRKLAALITLTGLLSFYLAYRVATQEVYHPTMRDFNLIRNGMSESEVKAILGPPHKVLTFNSESELHRPESPDLEVFIYYGPQEKGKLTVRIYNVKIDTINDQVCSYGYGSGTTDPSFSQRARRWFKNVFGL